MKDLFVPYQESLELKELGFDEPCLGFYDGKGNTELYFNYKRDASGDFAPFVKHERLTWFGAPTFSQAFRWFREKYKLSGTPQYFTGGYYCYTINDMKDTKESNRLFTEFETFEEAELAAIVKLIEIVKNKA